MRFSLSKVLVLALASTEIAAASSWFSKAVYNKWHETELERWLSDHDIPYPAASDRKELESLVKTNWAANVEEPLANAADSASYSFENIKDWVFDSWTDSSLKSFCDYHKIPVPQPRNRDSLLTAVRSNYATVAKKTSQYSAYPGDWLYSSWSESDLKEFLDTHGIPAPQPTTRDKLIAKVRRNSRLAAKNFSKMASEASSSAASGAKVVSSSASSAQASLSGALFDAYSDSQLKEFFDKHGIPVPQGSRRNEMLALARKHSHSLAATASSAASSLSGAASSSGASAYGAASSMVAGSASSGSAAATSAYGAASSKAGNQYAQATEDASAKSEDLFNAAVGSWSDSRLKAYLDARGVPVPQGGKRDELIAKVRLNMHKAATGWSAWTFDTWTTENLQKYLTANTKKAKKNAGASRDQLMKQAQDAYASASKSGGSNFASVTNYLSAATDAAKDSTFDSWSDSDLKSYLDSYGVPNYQGSTTNELKAMARKQANFFKYGTSTPQATIFESIKSSFMWVMQQLKGGAAEGKAKGQEMADEAASKAAEATASAKKEL